MAELEIKVKTGHDAAIRAGRVKVNAERGIRIKAELEIKTKLKIKIKSEVEVSRR